MRIAFDGKRAVFNNTGLGNYSRLIIDALSDVYPDNEYFIYTPKVKFNDRLTSILIKENVYLVTPAVAFDKVFNAMWRICGITRDLRADNVALFHGLSNELPINITKLKIPTIVTIHDLIFLRYPEYYKNFDRAVYNHKFRLACENATRIIAISECTKRDIIYYYDISPDKIDVVYQGCDPIFKKNWSEKELCSVKEKFELPDNFILNVGTIESRKNVLQAIKSITLLPNDIHAVIVGRATPYIEELNKFIKEKGLSDRVHFYHNVPFGELPAFYKLAKVFVYPSRFEGFGIPILEALSCGTPVIGATGSCLEEAGGEGSIYVNPDDYEAMAHAIDMILNDSRKRNTMIKSGLKYASYFNKTAIASGIASVYNKALDFKK
ncbi:MAG: glycosyltransferase family 1 protein [Muribaculaceae bacterium]